MVQPEIERVLRESGPLPFGKLASHLRSSRGLKSELNSLREQGMVTYESGQYAWTNPPSVLGTASRRVSRMRSRKRNRDSGLPHTHSQTLICVLRKNRGWAWEAVPLVPMYDTRTISVYEAKGCRRGDLVEIKTGFAMGSITGTVIRSWRGEFDAQFISEIVCRASNIPVSWPDKLAGSLADLRDPVTELPGRSDFRDVPLVTIDGDDAKDFDDAVAARATATGWDVVVAIADVSYYVPANSELDQIARQRGNSSYFADRAVPMLPEELSNGVCSLKPNVVRLAVVCTITIDRTGSVTSSRFELACIRSRARLTYRQVGQFLQDRSPLDVDSDVRKSLRHLHDAYKALLQAKERRQALSFNMPEYLPVLSEGMAVDVTQGTRNDAHGLIEEAMIAANSCAARFLETSQPPPLYRIHPEPSERDFREFCDAVGTSKSLIPHQPISRKEFLEAINEILTLGKASPVFEALIIRSMQKAEYSPYNSAHFALALDHYVHFTSPIRRYPDLYIHRLIKAKLLGKKPLDMSLQQVKELGWHTSATERRSARAERIANQWLVCQLLTCRQGEVFDATVAGISSFGVFAELDGYGVQGLIHMSQLKQDNYIDDGHFFLGLESGKRLAIGDQVRVRLEDVEPPTRKLDLCLVCHPLARKRQRFRC